MQIQVIVLVMNRWEELVNTSIIRRRWCCFFCLYNDWMLQVRLQVWRRKSNWMTWVTQAFIKWCSELHLCSPPCKELSETMKLRWFVELWKAPIGCSSCLKPTICAAERRQVKLIEDRWWHTWSCWCCLHMLVYWNHFHMKTAHRLVQRWVLHVASFTVWVDVFLTVLSHLQLVFLPSCRWFWRSALSA